MKRVSDTFFRSGEVYELRGVGSLHGNNSAWEGYCTKGIISGYFDDPEAFAVAACALDAAGARGIYFTINPVNPALLARAANRLKVPKSTTQDQDIVCIRWLLIDIDPKRPSDISSTNAELAIARDKARDVAAYLEKEMGFSRGIRAMTGNGYHLVYLLEDLPNNAETHDLIVRATAVIAAKFTDDEVDIDVKVTNPARIWKVYGTMARKGDSTPDRPHRQSCLLKDQPETLDAVPITPRKILESLAAMSPAAEERPSLPASLEPGKKTSPQRPLKKGELGQVDIERYLIHYGVGHDIKEKNGATFYRLDSCLFDPNHGRREASIVVQTTGIISYQCFHASCKARTWKEARRVISGEKSIAEFCAGYDPEWKPPPRTGTGILIDLPTGMPSGNPLLDKPGTPDLPHPTQIDPLEFMNDDRGKRPVFEPWRYATYLAAYLDPILHTSGIFYRYAEGVWREISKHQIAAVAALTLKHHYQAAWVRNVIETLAQLRNREEEEWSALDDIMMLNVRNGMIDLRTRELKPHDPQYGSRTQIPVSWDPNATCQRWHEFLRFIFPDDQSLARYFLLQQFAGYCFLRDCRFQKALFLYGSGANGKSTVLEVLRDLVGPGNCSSLSLQDLGRPFQVQGLAGKLINIATETNTKDPTQTEIFKTVVRGETVKAEIKHGVIFNLTPFAKFLLSMNEPPVVPDQSHGFGRSILVLNFNRRLESHEMKKNYHHYLLEERPGIFNWAMEGLFSLLKNDEFKIGDDVTEDIEEMLVALSPLKNFVLECCQVFPKARVSTTDLWRAYNAWCADGRNRPMSRPKFYDRLHSQWPQVKRGWGRTSSGSTERDMIGIELTSSGKDFAVRGKAREDRMFGD